MPEGPEEITAPPRQASVAWISTVVVLSALALFGAKKGCDALSPPAHASAAHPEEEGAVDFTELEDGAVLADMHDGETVPVAFKVPREEKSARPFVFTFLRGTRESGPIIRIGGRTFTVQNKDMLGGRVSLNVGRVTRASGWSMEFTSETLLLRAMKAEVFIKNLREAAESLGPDTGEHFVTLPVVIHGPAGDMHTTVTLILQEDDFSSP